MSLTTAAMYNPRGDLVPRSQYETANAVHPEQQPIQRPSAHATEGE